MGLLYHMVVLFLFFLISLKIFFVNFRIVFHSTKLLYDNHKNAY